MTDASENKQHLVFAVLLGIAGLLIILIFVTIRSQGDSENSATSANITNAAPSIDTIYLTDDQNGLGGVNIDLTENSTKEVYVRGRFTDNNGCDEVNGAAGIVTTLYRSGVDQDTNCGANNLNCRPDLACEVYNCIAGGADVEAGFLCTTTLQYFADATDAGTYETQSWKATATSTDSSNATGVGTSAGSDVNSLTAIGLGEDAAGDAIAYGELALGAANTDDSANIIWRNTGNTTFNPTVSSAAAMNCTVGIIPIANQHFATSSAVGYTGQMALSSDPTSLLSATDSCYAKATGTGAASSTGNIFWKIQLPANGISGSCTGTNVVNAVGC